VKNLITALLIAGALALPWACSRTYTLSGAPSAPTTITVSITSGTLGTYGGYYYQASGFPNDTSTGTLNLMAHVGDTVILPDQPANFHPLYFYLGSSSTCLYSTAGSGSTTYSYTFPSTGIYYFHCGIHAQNCGGTTASCGSLTCTALAGVITVQ
jgi:hypothetical protein